MSFGCKIMPEQIAEVFRAIRRDRPLIHMIPNNVSAALCADGLSALGARPLMAVAVQEMTEITRQADGSVINLGQPDLDKWKAARLVLTEASRLKKPLVLDPVGCGASEFRLKSVQELLSLPWQGIIKGNCSEIYSIQQNQLTREGIDAVTEREISENLPKGRVYLVTGRTDLVLWEKKSMRLSCEREHHPEKGSRYNIVGAGCLAGAVAGACYSVVQAEVAAVAASLGMAFSLEKAAQTSGYGASKTTLLDALCRLSEKEFEHWLGQRIDKVYTGEGFLEV